MRGRLFPLLAGLALLTGCYKDELDVAALTDNPFDPDYTGPAVFVFDTTFVETVDVVPPHQRQVFRFSVRSDLFLAPAANYRVRVKDLDNGEVRELPETAAGSNTIAFYKYDFTAGQPLCLEVAFISDLAEGRHETICGTLQ
ncbi:MAG: hypothetical protein JST66_08410 [Bacteroidetes bacterium]|nr:hypothetical protein [Bacteroidota bacterium]